MPVYHLELRKFPRTANSFNMTGPEVGAIVIPWVQERVVEMGDQKWSPHEAEITILEGPEIPLGELSMGRGWRTAVRESKDVTRRILDEARQALADGTAEGGAQGGTGGASTAAVRADSAASATGDQLALGVELGRLLGGDPVRLLSAWRAVAARSSGLAPSESLALAEREVAAGDGRAA